MPEPIVRSTLRQAVRDALVHRVITGRLEPGRRVNETTLARELGVSPTPVREALLSLEGRGFLTATPGKGFVLAPYDAREVHEVASVLSLLDTEALRLAGPFSPERLARLRTLNERFRRLAGDLEAAIPADVRWHADLVSTCCNRYLLQLIQAGRQRLHRYEYTFLEERLDTNVSADQHEAVIAALERGDLEAAIDALRANWERTIHLLVPRLEAGLPTEDGEARPS